VAVAFPLLSFSAPLRIRRPPTQHPQLTQGQRSPSPGRSSPTLPTPGRSVGGAPAVRLEDEPYQCPAPRAPEKPSPQPRIPQCLLTPPPAVPLSYDELKVNVGGGDRLRLLHTHKKAECGCGRWRRARRAMRRLNQICASGSDDSGVFPCRSLLPGV